jgi:hypothetical protein
VDAAAEMIERGPSRETFVRFRPRGRYLPVASALAFART